MRALAFASMVLGTAVLVLRSASGCGPSPTSPGDGETGVLEGPDVRPPKLDASTKPDAIVYGPATPPGYRAFTEYPGCWFSVPTEPKYLPDPVRWGPCLDAPETQGLSCRSISVHWEGDPHANDGIMGNAVASVNDAGKVVLGIGRVYSNHMTRFYAESDGPVLSAVSWPRSSTCQALPAPSADGRGVYQVMEGSSSGGVLGTTFADGSIRMLGRSKDLANVNLASSPAGYLVLTLSQIELHSWNDGGLVKVISAGIGGQLREPQAVADTVAFANTSTPGGPLYLYSPQRGTEVFAPKREDALALGDFNGDGVHWVWSEGSGRQSMTSGLLANARLVTSPFTRDPAEAMAKKRVVWEGEGNGEEIRIGGDPYIVGCGYAARHAAPSISSVLTSGALITRLADGKRFFVRAGSTGRLRFGRPIAITCDEVFFLAHEQYEPARGRATIARVRIDSLPPAPVSP